MEARLVIFIALAAVQLIFNAVVIGMIYLVFSKMTAKISKATSEFPSSARPREWLATLQSTSEQAVKVTGTVKDQIAGFESSLDRVQTSYGESLEKLDVRFKLACRAVHFTAEKIESFVKWPVRNVSNSSAFIRGVVDFIRGSESGAGARSRRTR